MKIFSKTISHREVDQVREVANFSRLEQLKLDETALQIELPNIFANVDFKTISNANHVQRCALLKDGERRNYHTYQPKKKLNRVNFTNQQTSSAKSEFKVSYYSLIKMLFPECNNVPPLDINILDTIFFNSDGSMTYIYTDVKKGLLKTKSKNYIQLFFKRKLQMESMPPELNSQKNAPKESDGRQFLKSLDYVALLRYKDENFIRLKDHQFKSIFIRPVQANQQYKIFNNTLYLQLIPQQTNYEQGTIFTVQFNFQKQKQTQLFNRVLQKHSQETSYNKNSQSRYIKQQVKQISVEVYLLYIIYEIYAYINFHQHKQLCYGIFEFIKVKGKYYLSNSRKVRISENQYVKSQYQVKQLFQPQVDIDHTFDLENEKKESEVLTLIDQMFAKQNQKIFNNISNIVNRKVGEITNLSDQNQSNSIFKLINQKCSHNLHYLFNNQKQYKMFINKKEKELDGFSALTSISNISRKRHMKRTSQINTARQSMQEQIQKENKQGKTTLKKYAKLTIKKQLQKQRPKTSKWYKRTLNGQKQYLIQKNKKIDNLKVNQYLF